jgi:hypothetical protein
VVVEVVVDARVVEVVVDASVVEVVVGASVVEVVVGARVVEVVVGATVVVVVWPGWQYTVSLLVDLPWLDSGFGQVSVSFSPGVIDSDWTWS